MAHFVLDLTEYNETEMKTITISTIIAGLAAGVLALWHTGPVKNFKMRDLTKKVRPIKEKESTGSNDHLFI